MWKHDTHHHHSSPARYPSTLRVFEPTADDAGNPSASAANYVGKCPRHLSAHLIALAGEWKAPTAKKHEMLIIGATTTDSPRNGICELAILRAAITNGNNYDARPLIFPLLLHVMAIRKFVKFTILSEENWLIPSVFRTLLQTCCHVFFINLCKHDFCRS